MKLLILIFFMSWVSHVFADDSADQDICTQGLKQFITKLTNKNRSKFDPRTDYHLTNRKTSYHLADGVPPDWIRPDLLKGKKVLDIGAGTEGSFVDELRNAGVDAFGVDLHAGQTPWTRSSRHIVRGNATRLPFKDEQFDVTYSFNSMFMQMYMEKESDKFLIQVLSEVKRVLKVGGIFRISPHRSVERLEKLLKDVPGLEITPETRNLMTIELKRIR